MYLKSCIFTLSVLLIHKQRTVLCEVNRYSQLSAPFNGSLQPCSNLPEHTCQFSYDKGHDLDGSARRTCTDNGTWTGAETQCNAMEETWEEFAANDEMSSPSEDRSPHYKLAWGILAGIIPLTLVKLIYIKKYHRWVLQLYLGQLSLNCYFKIFKNRLWGYQCWHNKVEGAPVTIVNLYQWKTLNVKE